MRGGILQEGEVEQVLRRDSLQARSQTCSGLHEHRLHAETERSANSCLEIVGGKPYARKITCECQLAHQSLRFKIFPAKVRSFYEDSTLLPGESLAYPLKHPRADPGTLQASCGFCGESTAVRCTDEETFQPNPGRNLSSKVREVSGRPGIDLSSSPYYMLPSLE